MAHFPKNDYTVFLQGIAKSGLRLHGVGCAAEDSLFYCWPNVKLPTGGTEHILAHRLSTCAGFITILSVYTSTLCSNPEISNQFCELYAGIAMVSNSTHLFLLGDFNARVGDDHECRPNCLGHWYWQDRQNRTNSAGFPCLSQVVHSQHVHRQVSSPGIMEAPKVM